MKLINAELVLTMLKAFKDEKYGNPHFMNGIATVMELIEDMPEAVVRCRDCEYHTAYDECNWDIGQNNYPYTDEDDFCSHGERKKR